MPACSLSVRRVRDGSATPPLVASGAASASSAPPSSFDHRERRTRPEAQQLPPLTASPSAPPTTLHTHNSSSHSSNNSNNSSSHKAPRTAQVTPLSPLSAALTAAAAIAAPTGSPVPRGPIASLASIGHPPKSLGMGHSPSLPVSAALLPANPPAPLPPSPATTTLQPLSLLQVQKRLMAASTLSIDAVMSADAQQQQQQLLLHKPSQMQSSAAAVVGDRSGSSSADSSAASSVASTPAVSFTSPHAMPSSNLSPPFFSRHQSGESLASNALVLPPAALQQAEGANSGAPRHLHAETPLDEVVAAGSVSSTPAVWAPSTPPQSSTSPTAAELQRRVDVLRCSLFGHLSLPSAVLHSLAAVGNSVCFTRGEALFRRGEVADCLFVIEEGQVCVEAQAPAESRSSAASPCSSPSAPLRRSSMLGLRGQVLPPIASSGFLASKSRRMSSPLPSPLPLPLSSIRECPVKPIRILRSNLSSEAPLVPAEEDRAQATVQPWAQLSSLASPLSPISPSDESASPTASPREVGYTPRDSASSGRRNSTRRMQHEETMEASATKVSGSSAPSVPSKSSTSASPADPLTKPLVLKGVGDVLGGESIGNSVTGEAPLPRRTYVTRCHSERVQLLVISYADLHARILPMLHPSRSSLNAPALCRLLNHEWLAHALRSLSCLRALPQASMLLLASLFRPVAHPAHSVLFKAGDSLALDSCAFVLYDGEVVVTEAEEIDSPAPACDATPTRAHSQLLQRGACLGESALFFSAGTPPTLMSGGGTADRQQSPAQTQAATDAAAAAVDRTRRMSIAGTRSSTARTTRPCVLFQLSRRAYVACAEFLTATGGDVQGSPIVKQPVPTLATIQMMQQQAEAAAAAVAAGGTASPASPGGIGSPNGAAAGGSPVTPARPCALNKYSDADLLLHPLFQKVFYVFCQQERPGSASGGVGLPSTPQSPPSRGQHELLEFWRDAVNYRTGYNKAQLSVGEEATILHRAYILRSAVKHMAHLSCAIQDRISSVVARHASGSGAGAGSEGGVDRFLFLDAERATEALIVSGPLARFKCSPSFLKIAPFVKIDPKMLQKNEQMRRSLTGLAADNAAAAAANGAATAAGTTNGPRATGAEGGLHRIRLHRANSVPDYVHVGMTEQPQAQAQQAQAQAQAAEAPNAQPCGEPAAAAAPPSEPPSPSSLPEGRHRSRSATDPSGAHSAAMVFQSERQSAELGQQQPEADDGAAVTQRHGSDGTLVAAGQ